MSEEFSNKTSDSNSMEIRRSGLLVFSGLALISACLIVVAFDISCFFGQVDLPFYGMMIAPVALFLAYLAYDQFRALFCCKPVESRVYFEYLFVFGGFIVLIGMLLFLGNAPNLMENPLSSIVPAGIFLYGLGLLYLGFLSRRVIPKLASLNKNDEYPRKYSWTRFAARKLIGILMMVAFVAIIAVILVDEDRNTPVTEEHISYEQFRYNASFPPAGTDFSYRRLYRGSLYCEFTISETGFREWIASQNRWEYCRAIEDEASVPIYIQKPGETEYEFSVSKGFEAGWGQGRGGRAVFDAKTDRVYYWTFY